MTFSLQSANAASKLVKDYFMRLPQPQSVLIATYVWIDGTGVTMRSKSRCLEGVYNKVQDFPVWNYDGSSTGQTQTENSDAFLIPAALFRDPFLGGKSVLVLCETFDTNMKPLATNKRRRCHQQMTTVHATEPWFGFEQEYSLLDTDGYPLGWPKGGFPGPQGPYYCGVGTVTGRDVVDAHLKACLYAGLQICGTNAEVKPSQWEFQIGPCEGIAAGDQLWVSRFILYRICEEFGISCTLDPKPVAGNWNGAGCHCNFSTKASRRTGGLQVLQEAIKLLSQRHSEHLTAYDPHGGQDNKRRLTGNHETSSMKQFTWGVADRSASVRISRQVADEQRGYLEDRRPSSNCDPYSVSGIIVETTLIPGIPSTSGIDMECSSSKQ